LSDARAKFSAVATFGIRDSEPHLTRFVKIGKHVQQTKERVPTKVLWWSKKWPTNCVMI